MIKTGYQIRDQNAIHFITFSVIQWVDVFTRKQYSDIVVESLNFCVENKGLKVHAWCLMSNHIHLIISCDPPYQLSDIIRDFKKYTSHMIALAIEENSQESRKGWMLWIFRSAGSANKRNEKYQFWQQGNHPIECTDREILESRMEYLHQNPVKAGIVYEPGDYVYSSGVDYYAQERGLVKLEMV